MVKGLKVEWTPKPSGSNKKLGPKANQAENELIAKEVQTLLEKNAIAQSTETTGQSMGNFFLRPKKRWGHEAHPQHETDQPSSQRCIPMWDNPQMDSRNPNFQGQIYEYNNLPLD